MSESKLAPKTPVNDLEIVFSKVEYRNQRAHNNNVVTIQQQNLELAVGETVRTLQDENKHLRKKLIETEAQLANVQKELLDAKPISEKLSFQAVQEACTQKDKELEIAKEQIRLLHIIGCHLEKRVERWEAREIRNLQKSKVTSVHATSEELMREGDDLLEKASRQIEDIEEHSFYMKSLNAAKKRKI